MTALLQTERGRRLLFTALYISEGAPIGYLWWALPPKLRLAGAPVTEITALTAALVLPWTFKFLWAPLVDRFSGGRFGLRAWIAAAQLLMGATLLSLLGLDLVRQLSIAAPLLMLHAFAAATQDVAVDALAVQLVEPIERGRLQGYTQTGMLAGRAAFGGGALLAEQWVGADAVLVGLVLVTWSSLALVGLSLGSPEPVAQRGAPRPQVLATLRAVLFSPMSAIALGFALLSGAGFEAVGALAGSLLVDRGVSQESVGSFFAGPTVLAMVAGALLGGRLSDSVERTRAVTATLLASVVSVMGVAACALLELGASTLMFSMTLCYLGIGLFVASSYALFMDLSDRRFGATHFSAYMGATNACEAWSGWAGGRLQASFGYGAAFAALAGVSLMALPLLRALASRLQAPAAIDVATSRP
ncbi:MAG: MFS transporter [Myxococcales bacterium]|nr:MFS transporter [Myxococcales bacterium]